MNKARIISNILERLMDTEDCLITDEHLDCIERILQEEISNGLKDEGRYNEPNYDDTILVICANGIRKITEINNNTDTIGKLWNYYFKKRSLIA